MSNVLQFKSFHERHFSPEQVKYWQQHILNQQQQQHSTWQWQQYNESYPSYHDNDPTIVNEETYIQEEEININMEQEPNVDQQQKTSLSQEAIEIFKFSEAYRKEREESEEKNIEEEEHDKWITNAYRNGIEAPVSCLVYHSNKDDDDDLETTISSSSPSSPSSSIERIRIQEHILNSNYLDTCRKGQVVLWPVLPLRL
ncbi:hypothetical protein INT45_008780 [Circinella minor]|uniref:Uncharacterized protein n=1 Tax=Circinella minor TaxID=1195481 RepID=A0A8H7VMN8_9FUNG|nr:hypothetical protein INT45_008780 [Circinella minor]